VNHRRWRPVVRFRCRIRRRIRVQPRVGSVGESALEPIALRAAHLDVGRFEAEVLGVDLVVVVGGVRSVLDFDVGGVGFGGGVGLDGRGVDGRWVGGGRGREGGGGQGGMRGGVVRCAARQSLARSHGRREQRRT
jgi:hypothetical protein